MEWISVDDRLPDPGQAVLRYGQDIVKQKIIDIGELVDVDGHRWADFGVTHWMPLPKPPDGIGEADVYYWRKE